MTLLEVPESLKPVLLDRATRLQRLANRVNRAAECVRLNREALAGAIPSTLEERADMLEEALEWEASAQQALLTALAHPEPSEDYKSRLAASLTTKPLNVP